jgi:hypothetical protein
LDEAQCRRRLDQGTNGGRRTKSWSLDFQALAERLISLLDGSGYKLTDVVEWSVKMGEKQAHKKRPSPQEQQYVEDVECEHGMLQPDVSHRRILNGEVSGVVITIYIC